MSQNRQRVGAYIAARRQELGLTQRQLGDRAGLSDRSVHRWETQTEGRIHETIGSRGLEAALGWAEGSLLRIEQGGEPVLADEPVTGTIHIEDGESSVIAYAVTQSDKEEARRLRAAALSLLRKADELDP